MSPLFMYVSSQIEELEETLEFAESGYFLEGVRSALINACDPMNFKNELEEFKRVMLVLRSADAILSSGAIPSRGEDNGLIAELLNGDIPTDLGGVYHATAIKLPSTVQRNQRTTRISNA
jgi:hypothetical protein